ncbi:hypothetical protein AGDE_15897 [Angomonas deanei]|uniref:Uncharacterized protein n=1 Tax=Angomonas deanei TaxID=59799 RepID=A0A7G2CNV5_9TRYP|nr:hypothetical protein AGDE_15897 [Angomonas deanei]CAD2220634.1 hypothetical protein, conserved [Angomonas deanei]|eukprot:EPY18191.1 hypothetical protein AGDE_15897 [Angomonas deanei]
MTIDRLLRKELIKASRNIKNHRNWSRQMPHYYSSTAELEASRPEETKDFYIPSLISIIDPDSVEKNGASAVNRYRGGFHLSDYYCPAYHVPTEHPANKGKREDDKSDTTSLSSYSYYYYTDEEESNQNETNNKSVSTVLSDTFADKKEKWFFYTLHRRKNKFSRNYVFTNRHENFKNNTFSAFPSESVLEAISHNNNNHNEDSVYSFCSCSFCNYRHDKKLNYSFANMDEYEEVEPATRSNNFNFFVKRNIKTLKKKRKPSHGVKPKESNVRVFRVNSGEVFYYDPTSKSKHQPKREGEKEKAILAEAILFNKERRKQQREKRKFYFTRGVQTWRALNRFRHKDTKMKKNPIVCHHAQGIDFSLFCRSPVQRSREDSTGLQRNVSNNTVNNNDSLSSCTNLSISTITNNNNSTVRVENMLPTFKKHESFKKEKIEKPNGPGGSILNHLDVSPPPKPPSRSSFHTTTANNNVTSTDGVLTFTPRRRNKVKVTSPSQPLSHDPNNNDSTIVSFGDLPHYNNTEGNYHRRGKSFDGSFKVSFSSQFVTQTGNPNNANNTKSKIKSVPPPNRIELPSHLSNSNRASLSSLMPYYRMGKEEDCSASYISRERTLDSFTSPGYHLPLNSSSRRGSHLCVPGIESIAFLNLNQKSGSANNNGGDGNSNSNRFRRREVTTETLLSTATSTYPTEVEDTLLSLCLSEGANNEEDISSTNVSLGL